MNENVATVTDTYGDLAKRGETLVARIRKQEATKATAASAKTTAAKAKTTKTQAKKTTQEGQLQREGDPDLGQEDRVQRGQGHVHRRFQGRRLK